MLRVDAFHRFDRWTSVTMLSIGQFCLLLFVDNTNKRNMPCLITSSSHCAARHQGKALAALTYAPKQAYFMLVVFVPMASSLHFNTDLFCRRRNQKPRIPWTRCPRWPSRRVLSGSKTQTLSRRQREAHRGTTISRGRSLHRQWQCGREFRGTLRIR